MEKLIHDPAVCKLGKSIAVYDTRRLALGDYLTALPTIPRIVVWDAGIIDWGMMLNDRLGSCTCAAIGHIIMALTKLHGTEIIPSDDDVLVAYEAVSGYSPNKPNSDDGATINDVLNYWATTGIAGHKILTALSLEPKNSQHIYAALYLFGNIDIGLQLPLTAQKQRIWHVAAGPPFVLRGNRAPGSWGGHSVNVVDIDQNGLTIVTWGALKKMTWGFWNTYCDEAYAVLSNDWVDPNKSAPNGFDLASLQQDLKDLSV